MSRYQVIQAAANPTLSSKKRQANSNIGPISTGMISYVAPEYNFWQLFTLNPPQSRHFAEARHHAPHYGAYENIAYHSHAWAC